MSLLLQNAAYGGIMILAVAVLRRVLKDKLIPEARLALWAVCLFRLLTPAAPKSVLSLWGLFQREAQSAPVPVPDAVSSGMGVSPLPAPGGTAPPASVEAGMAWGAVLTAVWVIVGTALAVRFALSYARTRRAVKCAILLGRDDPRYALLPRRTRLREGAMDGAPLTFGVVRPTVVLTPGLEGEELVCVLSHEVVHVRRRDNLWHYAMALALVIQWWNPAVWFMARLLRRDVELSCDRAAVKALGADKRAEYASTLVSMASAGADPAFCQTFGRKAAEERIISIMKFKRLTVIGTVLTLALVLVVTVGFASNPAERLPDEESTTSSAPAGRLPNEVSAYVEKLSVGMSRENVHILLGEPSFSMSSPIFCDTYELDDTHKPQVGIYYDVDSAVTQVKYFSDGTDPDAASIDLTPNLSGSASTVVYHGQTYDRAGLSAETLEWLDWYLALPEEEQLAVSYVPAELRDTELRGEDTPVVVEPDEPMTLEEYEALLESLVSGGKMSQEDAGWFLAGATAGMEGQSCPYLWVTEGGSYAIKGGRICTLASCGNNSRHTHNGEWYTGWTGKTAIPPYCTDENCTVSGQHYHEQNGEIVHCYNTAPALLPVCPVEGCTIWGPHTHDGVAYRCNGGHSGGVCDGSCATAWNEADTTSTAPTGEPGLGYDPRVEDSAGICGLPLAPTESEIPEFVPNYDPQVEDSIPVVPVDVLDSGHHSEAHHSNGHH